MQLTVALILFFVCFATMYTALKYKRYRSFSNFFISYMVSLIFLLLLYGPTNDELSEVIDSKTSLYFFILILGCFIFIIYSITMALLDYDKDPIKHRDSIFVKSVVLE